MARAWFNESSISLEKWTKWKFNSHFRPTNYDNVPQRFYFYRRKISKFSLSVWKILCSIHLQNFLLLLFSKSPFQKHFFFFFFPFRRSYYLLVALTSEGQLIFEEDREGSAFGVRLNDINFLNGARHSIYYVRDNSTVTFLVRLINDKRFRNSRHSRMTYNDHSSAII